MRYIGVLLTLVGCGFLIQHVPQTDEAVALSEVKAKYQSNLVAWSTLAIALDDVSQQSLQAHHIALREAFKRVEWLATYYDEGAINRYINGAPLPSVEQKVAELRILEPKGFQVLEELIYGSEIDSTTLMLYNDLLHDTQTVVRDLQRRSLTHADVFAAARYELIRIFTQGVTGFDTPSSGRALQESALALASVQAGIAPLLEAKAGLSPQLRDDIYAAFAAGGQQLTASNFDSFNRLQFLRTCIDPLYDMLLTVHQVYGAEMPSERNTISPAHNYESRSLFSDDFLNDYYFAGQPAFDSLFSQKLALGKQLFFDKSLSAGGKLSCATCHVPELGFSDGYVTSIGNDGKPLARNAPTLIGAVYAERYFTDMREPTLARQIRHVVQDEHEFGTTYLTILDSLRQNSVYRAAFASAYADVAEEYQISTYSLSDALASYVRSLHSNSSPVDRYIRGELAELPDEVKRGFNLFTGKAVCATCHFAPTWAGLVPPFYRETESEVLGVPTEWPVTDSTTLDYDLGRIGSGRPLDNAPFYVASFKTPSVRNVALTAPYMHNGVMDSLAQVVDFYQRGGGAGLGLNVPHQTLPFDSLSLNAQEQADLVAFMRALTDE